MSEPDNSQAQLNAEFEKVGRNFRLAGTLVAIVLTMGTIFTIWLKTLAG